MVAVVSYLANRISSAHWSAALHIATVPTPLEHQLAIANLSSSVEHITNHFCLGKTKTFVPNSCANAQKHINQSLVREQILSTLQSCLSIYNSWKTLSCPRRVHQIWWWVDIWYTNICQATAPSSELKKSCRWWHCSFAEFERLLLRCQIKGCKPCVVVLVAIRHVLAGEFRGVPCLHYLGGCKLNLLQLGFIRNYAS